MQDSKISVSGLNLFYGENHALKDINIKIRENTVMALIGPSGCGKSTFLKCLNRMNDLVDGVKVDGKVLLDGEDIYDPGRGHHAFKEEGGHGIPAAQSLPNEYL